MTIYISGPITGKKDFNRKAFERAKDQILKDCGLLPGIKIINPLQIGDWVDKHFREIKIKTPPAWADYMRADIKALMDCSHVFFLDGWQKSRGATVEHFIAQTLGIPCIKSMAKLKSIFHEIEGARND
jgi:hypothetical protein